MQISVWEPTATRYCGLAAITPDKGAVVLLAGFGKDHKGAVGGRVRGMIQKCFYVYLQRSEVRENGQRNDVC